MKGIRLQEKHHQGDTRWTQYIDLSGDVDDKDVDIGDIGAVQVDNYDGEEDFEDVTDVRTSFVDSDDDCVINDVVDVDSNEKLVNAVATNDNESVEVLRVEEPDVETEYDLFTADETETELRTPAYQIALNKLNSQDVPVEPTYPQYSSQPPNNSSQQNHHDEFKTSKRVPVLLGLLNKPVLATSSLIPFIDSQWAHKTPNESEATKHNEGYQLLKMKPRSTKIAFPDSSAIQPRTAGSEQIQPICTQSTLIGSTIQPRTAGSEQSQPVCTQSSTIQPRTAGSELIQPMCTQSSTIQPRTEGSEQIQPMCTQSSTTQPRTAGSELIQPMCTQSSTIQPRTAGSELIQPMCTQSTLIGSTIQPRTAGSEQIQPMCTQSTLIGSTTQPRTAGSEQIQPMCTQSSTIQPRTAGSELIQPRSTHFLRNVPWGAQRPANQPPTDMIHQSVKHRLKSKLISSQNTLNADFNKTAASSPIKKSMQEDYSGDVIFIEEDTEGQERKRSIFKISDCSSVIDSVSLRPCSVVLSRIDDVDYFRKSCFGVQNWKRCRKSEEKTATAATSRGSGIPDADTQLSYTDLQQNRETTVITPILDFNGNRETTGVKSKSQLYKKESYYLICRRKRFKFHRAFHTWAPKKLLLCGHCNQDFCFISYLQEHFRDVHREHYKYSCNICCLEIQPEKLLFHLQEHKSLGYQCGVCMNNFNEAGGLQTHLKQHKKKIIYKCGICMVKFMIKKKLKKHFYCHFPGFFRCEICNQRFRGHHCLTSHKNQEHGQVLVYRSTSTQTERPNSPDRIEFEEPDHDKMEDSPSGNEILWIK